MYRVTYPLLVSKTGRPPPSRHHKTNSEISPARIESLLHLSIQMSVAGSDPYKDGISSTFVKCVCLA